MTSIASLKNKAGTAEHAGYSLDYSALDQAELYPVMQASFLGDERPLSELILKIIAWPL